MLLEVQAEIEQERELEQNRIAEVEDENERLRVDFEGVDEKLRL